MTDDAKETIECQPGRRHQWKDGGGTSVLTVLLD